MVTKTSKSKNLRFSSKISQNPKLSNPKFNLAGLATTPVNQQYGVAFFLGPPNLTKSQAHNKLLDLGNLGGGG